MHGAFVEQSGRKQLQTTATATSPKTAQTLRTATVGSSRHGKEGSAVRVRERASLHPCYSALLSSGEATETRRGVHRASTTRCVRVLRGLELL
jgi:hypothetical protein